MKVVEVLKTIRKMLNEEAILQVNSPDYFSIVEAENHVIEAIRILVITQDKR